RIEASSISLSSCGAWACSDGGEGGCGGAGAGGSCSSTGSGAGVKGTDGEMLGRDSSWPSSDRSPSHVTYKKPIASTVIRTAAVLRKMFCPRPVASVTDVMP